MGPLGSDEYRIERVIDLRLVPPSLRLIGAPNVTVKSIDKMLILPCGSQEGFQGSPSQLVGEVEKRRSTVFSKTIANGIAIEFAQKSLLGARQHRFQPATRQKRAVGPSVAKTVDERLILVEASHDVANADVTGIPDKPNATLRASDALDISGSREFLQHFGHVVARYVEMIGNRRGAQYLPLPVSEKDQRS
jgi:hypothetical protein